MTFYVFAFVLFAVNFVISLLLFGAANDRKKMMRIQEQLKRLGAASEKENYRLRENSQHAIEIVNQKIVQAQNVMGDMDGKILDIQNRSQDLAKLQATLANYRQVMGQLASITDQAEARIQEIRGDIAEVEQIRQTIARFQEDTAKEKTAIETMRTEGETALKTMREENEAAVKSLLAASEEKLTGFQKQVEELMEKTKSSIDSYTEALEKQKQDALQAVEEQGKKFGEFEQQMKESLQKSEDDFKRLRFETVGQVDKDMSNFTISCAEKMETVFKQTIEQIDASFHTMVSTSQVFINELDGRLASAKDIAATLDANSAQRLEEVSKKLAEYTHQLTNNEALNATQESHKQQMEQSIDELQAETDALHGELERLKTEKAEIVREMEERAACMADNGVASVPVQAPESPDDQEPVFDFKPIPSSAFNAEQEAASDADAVPGREDEEQAPTTQASSTEAEPELNFKLPDAALGTDEPETIPVDVHSETGLAFEADAAPGNEEETQVPTTQAASTGAEPALDSKLPSEDMGVDEPEPEVVPEEEPVVDNLLGAEQESEPEEEEVAMEDDVPELDDLEPVETKEAPKVKPTYVPVGEEESINLDD